MRPRPAFLRSAGRHRQGWRVLALLLVSTAVWAVVLVALPFLLTVVGALLPLAAMGLLVRYLVRQRRESSAANGRTPIRPPRPTQAHRR
jgi:Flp pilus assembly protein TadB